MPQIESLLNQEKQNRSDTVPYIGKLLVRQRLINEAVFSFADNLITEDSVILDACAGPEGSFLASKIRGNRWIANDLSVQFANNLNQSGAKEVIVSNFSEPPFHSNTVDVTLFIFALNNICKINQAIPQASRITKSKGSVIISDPGLSMWITNILLLSSNQLSGRNIELGGENFNDKIPGYFADKKYSLQEYSDYIAENQLGIDLKQVKQSLEETYFNLNPQKRKKISYYFHKAMLRKYFQHIQTIANDNRLELKKSGYMITGLGDEQWMVSAPFELEENNWLEEFLRQRDYLKITHPDLSKTLTGSQRRLVFPILCFQKK